MALYLKYRPQNLDQLSGQDQIKQTLLTAFQNGQLSHAYLLVGPRGTGKTSTARILAKMVNCEKGGPIPCNECDTCKSITNGSNLDLIEIDAASNRGIDDIRSLRENIKLSPSSAQKKVYIIDEVHMLTTEAFNALLKTLEEPPSHALFILATTDAQKIPQTILSRVTRLDFKSANNPDLIKALKVIVEGEKIKIDDEALMLLAKAADGSFRDGVKLLDQLASSGETITTEIVEKVLQTSNFDQVIELLNAISKKDATLTLSLLEKQLENGLNTKELTQALMDLLRQLVFIKSNLGEQLVKNNFGDEKYLVLVELAKKYEMNDLVKDLDILQTSIEKLKTASILSLPLELAMVEICEDFARGPATSVSRRTSSLPSVAAVMRQDLSEVSPLATDMIATAPENNVNLDSKDDKQKTDDVTSPDILKIQEKWTFILETIRPFNFSLEALLRNVKIAECNDGLVILEVPYSFHQRILEAPKSRDLLESTLSEVLGKSIRVSTVLGVRPQRIEDIANVELAADDEIITMASEIFNGKLID
jgi:DNA polymerase III subunit gamma/tau